MRNLLSNVKGILNERRGIGFIEYTIGAIVIVALAATTYKLIGSGSVKTSNSLGTDINNFKVTVPTSAGGLSGNVTLNQGNITSSGVTLQ